MLDGAQPPSTSFRLTTNYRINRDESWAGALLADECYARSLFKPQLDSLSDQAQPFKQTEPPPLVVTPGTSQPLIPLKPREIGPTETINQLRHLECAEHESPEKLSKIDAPFRELVHTQGILR